MNDKVRILLFLLGAVVFNLLTLLICFILLGLVYVLLLLPHIKTGYAHYGLIPVFVLAAVLSFVIYRLVLKGINNRRRQ
jgi:hypothetical protein